MAWTLFAPEPSEAPPRCPRSPPCATGGVSSIAFALSDSTPLGADSDSRLLDRSRFSLQQHKSVSCCSVTHAPPTSSPAATASPLSDLCTLVGIEPLPDIRAPRFRSYLAGNLSDTGGRRAGEIWRAPPTYVTAVLTVIMRRSEESRERERANDHRWTISYLQRASLRHSVFTAIAARGICSPRAPAGCVCVGHTSPVPQWSTEA